MTKLAPPPPIPSAASLFLDFDGTLVEIAERPEAVIVDDAVRRLIGDLGRRLSGRVAVVSGRSITQLDALLGRAADGVAIAGSHGLERRDADGTLHQPPRPAALDRAGEALRAFSATREGTLVEDKSFGVALHYRLAPRHEAEVRAEATRLGAELGLDVQLGKMVAELKLDGASKGTAIAAMLETDAFRGSTPVMVGDDVTDEAGFAAAAAAGGWGVLVGPARDSAARYRLDDVAAVHGWLEAR